MKFILDYLQLFVLLVLVNIWVTLPVFAWEVKTHEELTDEAIKVVEGDLNTYLIHNLGLDSGLGEIVGEEEKMTVREWIIKGSNKEDGEIKNPLSLGRPANHFHEPTTNAGLSGESAINWALAPIGSQSPGGPWSWNDAREYYFKALTSPTKTERDENWGKTFRALGQVMHLIQDGANPAHVRADFHLDLSILIGTLGRIDVDGLHDYMAGKSVSSYVGGGAVRPDSTILESAGATRQEPFSNLFDRDTYTGLNPESTLGLDVGVTEYSHASFFSDDTIPFQVLGIPSHNFPSLSELIPATGPFPSDQSYLTLLRLGSPADPNARVAKFTGNQALAKFSLSNLAPLELIGKLELDDAVYDAQARHLIPRAVGYSAAVLTYFFRGNLVDTRNSGFLVFVENGPGGHGDCTETPIDVLGFLGVSVAEGEPPVDLQKIKYYYDKSPGEERVAFPSTSTSTNILLADLQHNKPVQWTAVYQDALGPGVEEEKAVFAQTGEAEWIFACD